MNNEKTLPKVWKALDNKLDKDGFEGTAQDLKRYTDTKVASLVESAPETLDTLKELSDALGNDPNFATTVANQIGNKLDKGNLPPDWDNAEKIKGKIEESLWHIVGKEIGNTYEVTDINNILADGVYFSTNSTNKFTNIPSSLSDTTFTLIVLTDDRNHEDKQGYKTNLIMSSPHGSIYTRSIYHVNSGWTEWTELMTDRSKLFLGNTGISRTQYIQDNITKEKGKGYFDKTTGELYICLATTDEKDVIKGKFELASNIENRYRIAKIEERLGIYSPISKITSISVSRDEGSTSPSLEYSEK